MKIKMLIFFFSLVSMTTAIAQDFIVLKTGTEIKCKIEKLTPKEVEYKPFDNLDGPTIAIDRKTVFMFRYPGRTEPNNPVDKGSGETNQQETASVVEKGFTGSIYGGVVFPLSTYSESNIDRVPNGGGAKTGFCIGLQGGYRLNRSISLLADAQYTSNAYSIKSIDGRYIYTYTGNWTNFSLMPSVKIHLPVTEEVNFYAMGSIGASFTKVTGDIADLFEAASISTNTTSLSYGITGGCIFSKHINIGIMYRTSTPTFATNSSFTDDIKINASVIQLSVGYQF
jgi:Outer membrane protein beta-barrel domain